VANLSQEEGTMIAVSRSLTPSSLSIVTIEAALSQGFGQNPALPRWSPRLIIGSAERDATRPVLDRVVSAMAGAGHSVAALSFYLGLREADVRKRIAALGLPQAPEGRLRRSPSKHPWTVDEVRRLITLWLDNVSVGSIAATLGRSTSSVQSKRRWLGLGVRERNEVADRKPAECQAVRLPWKPTLNVSEIALWMRTPGVGAPPAAKACRWVLGRDETIDMRFSILAFGGLRSPAIVERLRIELGLELSEKAVDNRISRLQILRERAEMVDAFDEELVQRQAADVMRKLGATVRQCCELNRSFWYYRTIGGSRWVCREFLTAKKYASLRVARSSCEVMGMAA
jgi:hypothetical protein